jgi:hypothetical protein
MVQKEKLFEMVICIIAYHYFRSLTDGNDPRLRDRFFSKSKTEEQFQVTCPRAGQEVYE